MNKASEAIFSLQPVTFRYKKALDPQALPQFGLVAKQVAKVDPELMARDDNGQPYTAPDEAVNRRRAMGLLEITLTRPFPVLRLGTLNRSKK